MGKKSRRNRGNDAGKRRAERTKPLASNNLANMIFYPEDALATTAPPPSGASVRGVVGHEPLFEVELGVFESRLQKAWSQSFASGDDDQLFERFTPILLALQDAGVAQNCSDEYRAESSTIRDSERRLRLQLSVLEQRLVREEESFLYVPLEAFYLNLPHELVEGMMARMGIPPRMLGAVMKGYDDNVKVYTHRKGPCPADRSRPPDEDLLGPHQFSRGLRLQCSMTPSLAAMFLYGMLKNANVSPSNVFVFPHALVFASKKGVDKLEKIMNAVGKFTPSIYHRSEELWCMAGKRAEVHPMTFALPWDGNVQRGNAVMLQAADDPLKHLDNESFMKVVKETGCCWYPLFSDNPNSSLVES